MASSTRFFSRKRLARSRCLLTSAAIRLNCPCRLAVVEFCPGRAQCEVRAVISHYTARKMGGAKPAFKRLVVNGKWPERLCSWLSHAVFWVPGALLFANVNDLPYVIRIVCADVRKNLRGFLQFCFVGGLHPFFEFVHDVVELLHGFIPGLGIELVEGLIVVAAE